MVAFLFGTCTENTDYERMISMAAIQHWSCNRYSFKSELLLIMNQAKYAPKAARCPQDGPQYNSYDHLSAVCTTSLHYIKWWRVMDRPLNTGSKHHKIGSTSAFINLHSTRCKSFMQPIPQSGRVVIQVWIQTGGYQHIGSVS